MFCSGQQRFEGITCSIQSQLIISGFQKQMFTAFRSICYENFYGLPSENNQGHVRDCVTEVNVTNNGHLEKVVPQRCGSCAGIFLKITLGKQLYQKRDSCISVFLGFLRNSSFSYNAWKRLEISRVSQISSKEKWSFIFFKEYFFYIPFFFSSLD